jgi:hypothetical protein
VIRLGQSVFDTVFKTDSIKDVRSQETSGRAFAILWQVGEGHPIIGQDLV